MRKVVLIYGSIAGLILVPNLLYLGFSRGHAMGNMMVAMIVGFSVMALAFTMVFFGVRSYRNNYQDGQISFLQALGVGLLIALIGSAFYVITWGIMYRFVYPEFMTDYQSHIIDQMKQKGASQEKLEETMVSLQTAREHYDSVLGFTLATFTEVFPVGLLASLISAAVLMKRRRKPETEVAMK